MFSRGDGGRLHAALLHPLNHQREVTLCFVAAFKKKNAAPSPLKVKQLQTLNVYWETCASHQAKGQSQYPAGLQGVIDRELLHTYVRLLRAVKRARTCVYNMSACVQFSSCLHRPVCLSTRSVNWNASMRAWWHIVYGNRQRFRYAALIYFTHCKLARRIPPISPWRRLYLCFFWWAGQRNCFHMFGGDAWFSESSH